MTTPSDAAPNWNGGDLPFARDLFSAADQLRGSVESATRDPADDEYFTRDENERRDILEDRDEYISENVFWVPEGSLGSRRSEPRRRGV